MVLTQENGDNDNKQNEECKVNEDLDDKVNRVCRFLLITFQFL